jgi:dTDP-4-amino-4,6-dideoxygalactose transaminase
VRPVPFVDLKADYLAVRDDVARRFADVLDSQVFVLGPQGEQLEAGLRTLTGAAAAVACASGTEALELALGALRIGAGHAVVVPALTFVATASAAARVGAQPVFADVLPGSFTMGVAEVEAALDREFSGPAGARVHRRTGARPGALIVVHLYGRAVETDGLLELARREGIAVIEDAAQAIGARSAAGAVGALGHAGCFSFYPTKNIGGAGDGGAVTTNDPELAIRLRALREHGRRPGTDRYDHVGSNGRLSELAAAYVNAKLPNLVAWTATRGRLAREYRRGLAGVARAGAIGLPETFDPPAHVWHQFAVRVPGERDGVRERMAAGGVETRVFYPHPLHLQPCFAQLGYRAGQLPEAEAAAREVLCLPIYPSLGTPDVERVCDALEKAVRR